METLVGMPRRLRLESSSDDDSENPTRTPPVKGRNPERTREGKNTTRRLQILDSPDLEEEEETRESPADPPSRVPLESTPENNSVEISNNDVCPEVQHFFTPPSVSPPRPQEHAHRGSPTTASGEEYEGGTAISGILRAIGARPCPEWLDSCIRSLTYSRPGFALLGVREQADLCFAQFLVSDMNASGAGSLPANVHSMHCVEIGGPLILQVDEIVNVSSPLRDRYKEVPSGNKRCLKLSMTDGVQRVFGIEYRPIKDLKVLAPAGLKVAVQNVYVRRGLLMLVPEVLEVLGGSVEYLEAARRKLVDEVTKPPRGKRTKRGEEVGPLVQRARNAAWPPNALGHLAGLQAPIGTNRIDSQTLSSRAVSSSETISDYQEKEATQSATTNVTRNMVSTSSNVSTSVNSSHERHGNDDTHMGVEEEAVHLADLATSPLGELVASSSMSDTLVSHLVMSSDQRGFPVIPDRSYGDVVTDELPSRRVQSYSGSHAFSNVVPGVDTPAETMRSQNGMEEERLVVAKKIQLPPESLENLGASGSEPQKPLPECSDPQYPPVHASSSSVPHETVADQLAVDSVGNRPCNEASNTCSAAHKVNGKSIKPAIASYAKSRQSSKMLVGKSNTVVGSKSALETHIKIGISKEDELPPIFSGEKEIPFTYMAHLLAKHSLKKAHAKAKEHRMITRGTIKCFLTGVKGFQFRGKIQFELRVYIDDGSLISEVLIDHNVVQKGLGYTTAEVTAALSSPNKDTVSKMKEVMKRFQHFLTKFEGTMLIEMNETSLVPIALEMNQGCTPSDAWLLLRRLKAYSAPESEESPAIHINISP